MMVLAAATGFADNAPDCLDKNSPIPVINDQVLDWKTSTANQYRQRAHIAGKIAGIYPNENGHQHFAIQIGSDKTDLIEVIYNTSFGRLPRLSIDMDVEACGDYITSNAQAGPYPPSPVGAIIHWIHRSPNLEKHESGYLMIDGTLYGQDAEKAGPKKPRPRQFSELFAQ
jgi:hypothetical protein